MSPARETGRCRCHEHQSVDRLREIIREKDDAITGLRRTLHRYREQLNDMHAWRDSLAEWRLKGG